MILSHYFPYSIWDAPWLAPLALIMDLLLADPPLPWHHPVCLIGNFLNYLEPRLRRMPLSINVTTHSREKLGGFIGLVLAAGGAFFIVWVLLHLPFLGTICAIYLAWAGLAFGCLAQTGRIVLERVESGDLHLAREGVGWLVSRDISQLDQPMLRKTLADTLAENFTDAFLAPYFWLLLTGPAGLWFYKAVSTIDSQWGYMTPQWRYLGYAGAKGDDCMAWLPARIAPAVLCVASMIVPQRLRLWTGKWPGYATIRTDARGMPSPNSGWSMSACAWLCNGRMAGPSIYFGELVWKEWMGPPQSPPWNKAKLLSLIALMSWGALIGGSLLWLLVFLAMQVLI